MHVNFTIQFFFFVCVCMCVCVLCEPLGLQTKILLILNNSVSLNNNGEELSISNILWGYLFTLENIQCNSYQNKKNSRLIFVSVNKRKEKLKLKLFLKRFFYTYLMIQMQ